MLSCLLYLIFILDIPDLFYEVVHPPLEYRSCKEPNISTFVDDNYVIMKRKDDKSMEESGQTMSKLKSYMDANKLALNKDKSKILLVTKNQTLKDEFSVIMDGRTVRHSQSVKILGTWDSHLKNELISRILEITQYFVGKFCLGLRHGAGPPSLH